MAKSTRQQRRERRQQAGDGAAARPRARQSQVRAVEPAKSEHPRSAEHRRFRFIAESWAELKKVEWPGQNQVIQGTVVVLVACTIVGLWLYANDLVWKRVVQWVLGQ